MPRAIAEAAPASGAPPPPRTPTSANCDAPVKTSSDITQHCSTDRPALLPAAPNVTPLTPTATPTPSESRTTARGSGSPADDSPAADAEKSGTGPVFRSGARSSADERALSADGLLQRLPEAGGA